MRRHAAVLLYGLGLIMSGCDASASSECFVPETALPERSKVLGRIQGESGRQIVEAAFAGEADQVAAMLRTDPALGKVRGGDFGDLLSIAIARCDPGLLDRMLSLGVDPNGPEGSRAPLLLALRSKTPVMAERLLKAGASPNPRAAEDPRPLDEAILIGSAGAVRLLLDRGADPNLRGKLGETPLHVAVDSHRFRLAELLVERGADPWATDDSGGTLGASIAKSSLSRDPEDEAARRRLEQHVRKLGWPWPPPNWRQVKALRAEGKWPPVVR